MILSKPKKEETSYSKGVRAENIAADYLQQKGFDILETRYKTKFGEIDIIATQDNLLCFIEVKVRKNISEALESVTARTQKRIEKSALFFLSEHADYSQYDMRFDVITISGDMFENMKITHLDNAWLASS